MPFTVLLAVVVIIMLVGIFTQLPLRGNLQRTNPSKEEPDQVQSMRNNVPNAIES